MVHVITAYRPVFFFLSSRAAEIVFRFHLARLKVVSFASFVVRGNVNL